MTPLPPASPGGSVAPPTGPAARVRVTSSRRGAPRVRARRGAADLDEQTELGDVYLDGLMRAQLRLALTITAIGLTGLVGLPLLFVLVPGTRSLTFFGLPFAWLVLGFTLYPAMWGLARWYTRQSERVENEFCDVVERG